MEISSIKGLYEMGLDEHSFISQCQWNMNSVVDLSLPPLTSEYGETMQNSLSHQIFNPKTSLNAFDSFSLSNIGPIANHRNVFSPDVLSFTKSINMNQMGMPRPKQEAIHSQSINRRTKLPHNQDHIIAERKRREKLSKQFVALSAIVPGLKKMDKASILGDAINYLKQLQEKVKLLEEQASKKGMESMVVVKKYEIIDPSDNSSSTVPFDKTLPEIEARFCEKNVLIKVHCVKRKGVVEMIVAEIEKLHLIVMNTSVLTFGSSALDVTVIAQMGVEFSMSVKDVAKGLQSACELFM